MTFIMLFTLTAWLLPAGAWDANAAAMPQGPRISEDDSVSSWDCVTFGRYPQSADGQGGFKTEPIKWRVLSVNGNEALLLSDKNLDAKVYNESEKEGGDSITWEKSSVRRWLNDTGEGGFLKEAFTPEEQNAIIKKTIQNPDHPDKGTPGGSSTEDKVFFLSVDDAANRDYGFPAFHSRAKQRQSLNTDYVKSLNVFTSQNEPGMGIWWLRSPGHINTIARCVGFRGDIQWDGMYTHKKVASDRPALYLDLTSGCWSNAGTVSSDNQTASSKPDAPAADLDTDKNSGSETKKAKQYITCASSFTKTYGGKAFYLNASASGKGNLTYKSHDTKVVRVNSSGLVTPQGPGKTNITVTAGATVRYHGTSKDVTITVKPKQLALKKVSSKKKKTLTATWKRDPKATGYRIAVSKNRDFKKIDKLVENKGNKTTKATFTKLSSKKTYYVKARAYKKSSNVLLYGAYSKAKKIKVK